MRPRTSKPEVGNLGDVDERIAPFSEGASRVRDGTGAVHAATPPGSWVTGRRTCGSRRTSRNVAAKTPTLKRSVTFSVSVKLTARPWAAAAPVTWLSAAGPSVPGEGHPGIAALGSL